MNIKNIHDLERYGFLWSEARLLIAALALLINGVPPIYLIAPPGLFALARFGLVVSWLVSGAFALFLMYRWHVAKHTLFTKKRTDDMVAFLILGISGLNLGLVPILGKNIGMSFSHNRLAFLIVAAAYIYAAYHLYSRWKSNGEKLF